MENRRLEKKQGRYTSLSLCLHNARRQVWMPRTSRQPRLCWADSMLGTPETGGSMLANSQSAQGPYREECRRIVRASKSQPGDWSAYSEAWELCLAGGGCAAALPGRPHSGWRERTKDLQQSGGCVDARDAWCSRFEARCLILCVRERAKQTLLVAEQLDAVRLGALSHHRRHPCSGFLHRTTTRYRRL